MGRMLGPKSGYGKSIGVPWRIYTCALTTSSDFSTHTLLPGLFFKEYWHMPGRSPYSPSAMPPGQHTQGEGILKGGQGLDVWGPPTKWTALGYCDPWCHMFKNISLPRGQISKALKMWQLVCLAAYLQNHPDSTCILLWSFTGHYTWLAPGVYILQESWLGGAE